MAEHDYQLGNTRNLYIRTIRIVSRKLATQPGLGIKDENGDMIHDNEKIKKRWHEYMDKLFLFEQINDSDTHHSHTCP